jgi:hypothetical protein
VLPLTSYGTYNTDLDAFGSTTFPLEKAYGMTDYPSNRVDATNISRTSAMEVIQAAFHFGTDTTSDGRYLGDLVEYNRGELTERVISDIFHRFNTTWRAFGYSNKREGVHGWAFGEA